MNKVLKDSIFYKDVEDPYMTHNFINFTEMNEGNPTLYKMLKNVLLEYPQTLEISQNVKTKFGDFFIKVIFVSLN